MALPEVISLVLFLNALIVIVLLIYEERDPSTTLAWALALMLFPGVGLVFYLLFGRNWRSIGTRDRVRLEAQRLGREIMAPRYETWGPQAREMIGTRSSLIRRVSQAIESQNGTRVLPCDEPEVFTAGETKFARLFEDVESARHSIHLQYFIWESDELTGELCDLLAGKVRAGVEVRVMYDWVGSLPYGKSQLSRLEKAGAKVHADAAHWSRVNYRNHCKIAVIDGRVGYTGGMNMGKEYIDGRPRYESWRDTHIRITGPLVADLQRLFAERWFRVAHESLFAASYFPQLDLDAGSRVVWAQLAHSGPESEWEALRNAFHLAVLAADREVRIQSPYFVPDEALLQALVTQSLGGVDVQFMMTGVPDKRIAWNAAFSYIDELILAGGRLFQYDAGFFHPKTMTVDGELCVIGTTNFDIRSFMLHDELSIFFYDARMAVEHEAVFSSDLGRCHEVSTDTFEEFSRLERFRNALARLSSRLL